jgi:hypothetical protein
MLVDGKPKGKNGSKITPFKMSRTGPGTINLVFSKRGATESTQNPELEDSPNEAENSQASKSNKGGNEIASNLGSNIR